MVCAILINKVSVKLLPGLVREVLHAVSVRLENNQVRQRSRSPPSSLSLKSVNPKISRIGRQKQKHDFFFIWPNKPIWLPVFGNDIKRFNFLFFSSKFAKLENSATRPSAAAMRLEIWHKFNMLVWTYQTLPYHALYTVCGTSLKLYSELSFVLEWFVLQNT